MKLKTIQKFIIVFIVITLVQFAVRQFAPSQYVLLKPVFEGMFIGLIVGCMFYYGRIYVRAWLNNRKESAANQNGTK